MAELSKQCPRCSQRTRLDTPICGRCGRQFTAPPPERQWCPKCGITAGVNEYRRCPFCGDPFVGISRGRSRPAPATGSLNSPRLPDYRRALFLAVGLFAAFVIFMVTLGAGERSGDNSNIVRVHRGDIYAYRADGYPSVIRCNFCGGDLTCPHFEKVGPGMFDYHIDHWQTCVMCEGTGRVDTSRLVPIVVVPDDQAADIHRWSELRD